MADKAKRQQLEKKMVDDLEEFLKLAKIRVRRQLYCGYMGFADLVTDCCVYEAKVRLNSHNMKYGTGQAIIYRDYIDKEHKRLTPVVMGRIEKRTNEGVPYLAESGIAVLAWRPMKDYLFTENIGLLEGIKRDKVKELNDEILWKMAARGEKMDWPDRPNLNGVSAIELPANCPLVMRAAGNKARALENQIRFREAREQLPLNEPEPMEGLKNPQRVRYDEI
jgi:hypothetical protein